MHQSDDSLLHTWSIGFRVFGAFTLLFNIILRIYFHYSDFYYYAHLPIEHNVLFILGFLLAIFFFLVGGAMRHFDTRRP